MTAGKWNEFLELCEKYDGDEGLNEEDYNYWRSLMECCAPEAARIARAAEEWLFDATLPFPHSHVDAWREVKAILTAILRGEGPSE